MSEASNTPMSVETYPISFDELPDVMKDAMAKALHDEYDGHVEDHELDAIPQAEDIAMLRFEGVDSLRFHIPAVVRYEWQGHSPATTFIIDTTPEGEQSGLGILIHPEKVDDTVSDRLRKTFVGYTETNEDYRRDGLGARRLRLMNQQARERYGEPLHSDPRGAISDEARAVWQKLVEQGEAEFFEDEDIPRYRFTSTD